MHRLQAILFQTFVFLFSFIPFRAAVALARGVGLLYYALDHEHRKIGLINLHRASRAVPDDQAADRRSTDWRRAFGSPLTLPQAKSILRRAYQHLVVSVIEFILFPRLLRSGVWKSYFEFQNEALASEVVRQGRGSVVITAHLGNWELCGLAVPLLGYPLTTVVKPLKNPYLERFFSRLRNMMGQQTIPKEGAYRSLLKALQEKRNVTILLDQNAKEEGLFVDFFGRPASTLELPAKLALRLNIPVILVYTYRKPSGRGHVIVIDEWLDPKNPEAPCRDSQILTAYLTKKLEDYIRQFPDQWIWMYRRWLHRPDGTLENYEQPLRFYWTETKREERHCEERSDEAISEIASPPFGKPARNDSGVRGSHP